MKNKTISNSLALLKSNPLITQEQVVDFLENTLDSSEEQALTGEQFLSGTRQASILDADVIDILSSFYPEGLSTSLRKIIQTKPQTFEIKGERTYLVYIAVSKHRANFIFTIERLLQSSDLDLTPEDLIPVLSPPYLPYEPAKVLAILSAYFRDE